MESHNENAVAKSNWERTYTWESVDFIIHGLTHLHHGYGGNDFALEATTDGQMLKLRMEGEKRDETSKRVKLDCYFASSSFSLWFFFFSICSLFYCSYQNIRQAHSHMNYEHAVCLYSVYCVFVALFTCMDATWMVFWWCFDAVSMAFVWCSLCCIMK